MGVAIDGDQLFGASHFPRRIPYHIPSARTPCIINLLPFVVNPLDHILIGSVATLSFFFRVIPPGGQPVTPQSGVIQREIAPYLSRSTSFDQGSLDRSNHFFSIIKIPENPDVSPRCTVQKIWHTSNVTQDRQRHNTFSKFSSIFRPANLALEMNSCKR